MIANHIRAHVDDYKAMRNDPEYIRQLSGFDQAITEAVHNLEDILRLHQIATDNGLTNAEATSIIGACFLVLRVIDGGAFISDMLTAALHRLTS